MPSSFATTTLSAILAAAAAATTASATSITFQNVSPNGICYTAELSSGTFPSTTTCGPGTGPGISVPAGSKTTVLLDGSFNGALTAWTNGVRGARYEVNFAASATSTWYDADYQLGMSDGTVGPLDHRALVNGNPSSTTGEPDTLAKANAAWPPPEAAAAALLAYPDYIKQDAASDGKLSFVYCDAHAPPVVVDFFQVTAAFEAYVDAGSVVGGSKDDAQAVRMADVKSLEVGTQDMLIVAH